ncbi:plastocyanin/azurin family copper-binding protein [Halobacteria archaeon AArc-curdl1]|uniref:Plastocyanin/azurin family copper-binding protein n=1 Tax=Natronosalvus hydrolyticus TaxID=2979988 RepID=A0AAP2ZEI7_9EURY|nr:plastocyanin/azurin family copper-binding protein [Halobacteria archaeon AArc-curdl1]
MEEEDVEEEEVEDDDVEEEEVEDDDVEEEEVEDDDVEDDDVEDDDVEDDDVEDDDVEEEEVEDDDELREIKLGARVERWIGKHPEEIEEESNPTLELEEGQEYSLTWENLDGVGHNFVIEDEDGDIVIETDILMEDGGTQTVEFTAESGMAEYYCRPHPLSMRGQIEILSENEQNLEKPKTSET